MAHSASPLAIRKAIEPAVLLVGGSVALLGLVAQLSTFVLATEYTTTQTQSLQNGDTISTTANGTAGYGLWSQTGTTLAAPGNNTITTTGASAHGLVSNSMNFQQSNVTAAGTSITVGGPGAYAAYTTYGSLMTLQDVSATATGANGKALYIGLGGTANVTGNSVFVAALGNGVEAAGNGSILTLDGATITANGDNVYGLRIFPGSATSVTGATRITTTGDNSAAVWSTSRGLDTGGTIPEIGTGASILTSGAGSYGIMGAGLGGNGVKIDAATIVTQGDKADGARAGAGGRVILNGTHVTTHGDNAAAAVVGNDSLRSTVTGATVAIANATLTTTGDGSNGIQIYGSNDITMNMSTSVNTSGVGSHGISMQGGASKAYVTDTTLAGKFSITGKDSAAFHATGANTSLTMSGFWLPAITLGVESWTTLAEDGGTITIFGTSPIDGGGVWARGADANNVGTVVLSGGSVTAQSARLRADANGIVDISGLTDKTGFSVGSLSGDSGTIRLGTTSLTVDGAADTSFGGTLVGTGSLIRGGSSGSLTLTGDNNAYKSAVSVTGGTLLVDGRIGGAASVTGGTLGGSGMIGGDISVAAGGNLAGRQGQVLAIGGNLTLAADSTMTVALGKPEDASAAGLFRVAGDLTLGGTLDVTDLGGFAPGLYRLVDYGGALTDNGMSIGDVPDGSDAAQMYIQTSVAHQINLVNMSGADLNFWDGGNMANHGNGAIDGGTGTWNTANTNWADQDGTLHGAWSDGQFAIFSGTAGTVTVDNSGGDIVVDGMQFAVDGYRIEGGAVTLQDGEAIMRVGVGNGAGKGMSATIASELKGNASLNKMDYGTLVLAADNSYSGGTTISEGTLQLGDGGTTGNVQGDILNNATFAVDRSGEYTLAGTISGTGNLVQKGSGSLILTAENSYSGGTTIDAGILQLGNGGTSGSIKGNVINDGILAVNRSDTLELDGSIGGTGALQQNGTGTTVLTGDNVYSGGTTINAGTLQIGNGGTKGSITGDVTNNATLSFNRSDQLIFSKTISGTGSVTQDGTGTTLMTGANTYTGATRINAGRLQQKMHGSFSSTSDYEVGSKGVLDIGGYKTTLASLSNSGVVRFGENAGAVVNVTGNYTGNGGTLVLSTVLGADNSKTDLLKIGGDTSGTSTVTVINRGGVGGQTNEGIKIIDVGGQSNGTFSLAGDYTTKDGQQAVVAGAYAYTLHEGGVNTPTDGDWYLRSERKDGKGPVINPGIPLYQGAIQAMQALNRLPTLQQRVGNRYWNGAANPVVEDGADAIGSQTIWGRIEAAHNRLEADTSGSRMKQDIDTFIMQAGVGGQFYEGESGKLIGGVTGQYGNARSGISSAQSDGTVDTQGWGLGGTLTWYGDNGFYVDGQAQASRYDNDFNSTTVNKSLANGRKGFGYALSAEVGQRIDVNDNWSLTPQAQLMWSSVDFDGFNDVWGTAVALRAGDSLTGRVGLSADYRRAWAASDGQIVRTSLYGIANIYQELMGDMSIKVAGVNFGTGNDRTWGGIGAGGTYTWADDRYALYGEGSLNTSLNNFAHSYAIKGSAGFRVRW